MTTVQYHAKTHAMAGVRAVANGTAMAAAKAPARVAASAAGTIAVPIVMVDAGGAVSGVAP